MQYNIISTTPQQVENILIKIRNYLLLLINETLILELTNFYYNNNNQY